MLSVRKRRKDDHASASTDPHTDDGLLDDGEEESIAQRVRLWGRVGLHLTSVGKPRGELHRDWKVA
jgi:hypothetical protein